ncbi:MAG: AMP-binding protein [Syntrophomonadaceae bacterium]|nr:AMP-binding protein [Syntrophomonadaceae bacterium]
MNLEEQALFHRQAFVKLQKKDQPGYLGRQIKQNALERPDHPAIIYGDQVLTYKQFDQISDKYACYFREQGFRKGDVVAIIISNRPAFLCAVTGLSKLGVITALINSELRGEVLAKSINTVQARAVIIGHELLSLYKDLADRIRLHSPGRLLVETEGLDMEIKPPYEDLNRLLCADDVEFVPDEQITSDDVLAYLFTSGVSGPRKCVPIRNQRFLAYGHVFAGYGHLNRDSIQYTVVPLYLNSGFGVCFPGMAVTASTMVLRQRFSLKHFWDDVRKYSVDYFIGVGEMCRYLYNLPPRDDDGDTTLRTIMANGMLGVLVEPFKNRFKLDHVVEIYGNTEGFGGCLNYEEKPGMCGNLYLGGLRMGEVVRCNFMTEEILRGEDGFVIKCQPGETGLYLCEINEASPLNGYINDPEATAAKIVENVLKPGDKYFNTMDLMVLHENDDISFADRLGDTYRWKGKTVSAHAVADVIIKFFGPIEDAYVYGVKVPGMEGRCGMAAITLIEGEKLDWKKFSDYIGRRMPEHARPLFIRLCKPDNEVDYLIEYREHLKSENYSPSLINDPLYYFNPDKNGYYPLTPEIYELIQQGKIAF